MMEGMPRVDADEAGPGEIVALAGIPEITIGETIADPEDPAPLPPIAIDEPALGMTIGINTSPLAGKSGDKLTARQVQEPARPGAGRERLDPGARDRAPRHLGGAGPRRAAARGARRDDAARGLRADGGQAAGRHARGSTASVHEPVERLAIDVPEDFLGVTTQLLALRKGRMEQMVNHGTGWVRVEYLVPARGLIGFRTEFLTETRGSGILHSVFERYEPWYGEIKTRPTGSLVADRRGETGQFALLKLQERGQLFVGPGEEVYEGMVVGRERARRGPRRERRAREEADQRARRGVRRHRPAGAPPPALARPGARVHPRGRVRGGHPGELRLRKVVLDAGERQKLARTAKRADGA